MVTIFGIVLTQNFEYLKNRDWGYNKENVVVIPLDGEKQYNIFNNEISRNHNVLQTAGSVDMIGMSQGHLDVEVDDAEYDVHRFIVGFDYLETLELELKDGRVFDKNLRTDVNESVIVNETFVESFGWQDAIGKRVVLANKNYTVIGVVKDFIFSVRYLEPTVLRLANQNEFHYLTARMKAGTAVETEGYLKETWSRLFPDTPYRGFAQDSVLDGKYAREARGNSFFPFVATLTLVLSCMGLFGLISLNLLKQMKELSIRKVLGASAINIVNFISKDSLILIVIAAMIATPISYFALSAMLDSIFDDHIALGPLPFISGFGLIALIVVATISLVLYKTVIANPVDALRNE